MNSLLTITATLLLSLISTRAGLLDSLGFGKKATNETAAMPIALTASLSQDQVAQGLKEALGRKGVQQAVTRLGHEGGFPAVDTPGSRDDGKRASRSGPSRIDHTAKEQDYSGAVIADKE
jgi:hypothetical protein